jgi:hypothetical protein
MRFVVCMELGELGDFSGDDLTIGRVYEVLEDADEHGMLRIIDDSGEDYLYPYTLFEPVDIPAKAAERLHNVFACNR